MNDLAAQIRPCRVGDLAIILRSDLGYEDDVGKIVRIVKRAPGRDFEHEGQRYMECKPGEWLVHSPDGFAYGQQRRGFCLFDEADLHPIRGIEDVLQQACEHEAVGHA